MSCPYYPEGSGVVVAHRVDPRQGLCAGAGWQVFEMEADKSACSGWLGTGLRGFCLYF